MNVKLATAADSRMAGWPEEAQDHARSVGVSEPRLDWVD
jgi:hypothetical protein